MNDNYLWDRSGPPDPEVERLEQILAPLRFQQPAPAAARSRWFYRSAAFAAAAVILIGICLWLFRAGPGAATAWQVAEMEGASRLGRQNAAIAMPVRVGQVLRTGQRSVLTLQADAFGRIDLGPNSAMRADSDRQIFLHRGTLHAMIWAPPRQFVVDTPSARAVDLGCEYTIELGPAGDGLLRVAMGWVAFEFAGQETFVPAGAECVTRKRKGPGIPFYEDAPIPFRHAVGRWENGDSQALPALLASARPGDGLTLWHLLTRVPAAERGAVFDRFAALVSLPPDASRDRVLRQDPAAIDACWDALNLENTGWWRGWKRNW